MLLGLCSRALMSGSSLLFLFNNFYKPLVLKTFVLMPFCSTDRNSLFSEERWALPVWRRRGMRERLILCLWLDNVIPLPISKLKSVRS